MTARPTTGCRDRRKTRSWAPLQLCALAVSLLACAGPDPSGPRVSGPAGTGRFADLGQERSVKRFDFDASSAEIRGNEPQSDRASSQTGESKYQAAVRLRLPSRESFVLHATVPVPRGAIAGGVQFALRPQSEGAPWVEAQWETVTRYPSGEPDVVELAARVQRPAGSRPGQWLTFDVQVSPPGPEQAAAAQQTTAVFAAWPKELELRCRDVHGHLYTARLLDELGAASHAVQIAAGSAYERVRLYATLTPEAQARAASKPALEHLMGVHAYLTRRMGDGRISLDLRIHNGATSGAAPVSSQETAAGIVYWDALELVLPRGWSADALVRDPYLGRGRREGANWVLPLVKALPQNALHMMGPQSQFLRRLTLYGPDTIAERGRHPALEGQAFCVEGAGLWSWWNPETARYFAQRTLLASWSSYKRDGKVGQAALEDRLAEELQRIRKLLKSGKDQHGLLSGPLMGWCHPLGVSIQGMTGGSGIYPIAGQRIAAAADSRGIETLMLEHRMHACRQSDAQWNQSGQPVGFELWRGSENRVPFDFRTNGNMVPREFKLPARGGPPASEQVAAVYAAKRRPPYDQGTPARVDGTRPSQDDALLAWWPHDGQHMVRYTSAPKALVWLANDALARDSLLHAAELFHLAYHGARHAEESWSPGATLRVHEEIARTYPGHGLPIGRDQAWGIDAACAAYSCATPQWRATHQAWLLRVAQLFLDGAMPSGILQRQVNPKVLDGRYASSQTFESLFLLHAERCLIESVLKGVDSKRSAALLELHHRALHFLYWGPVWSGPRETLHSETPQAGPRWHFAVAPKQGFELEPYCDVSKWGEDFLPDDGLDLGVETRYGWGPLEYAMTHPLRGEAGGLESRYLTRSLDVGLPARDVYSRVRGMFREASRESNDHSGSWAGYVGSLQALGVR